MEPRYKLIAAGLGAAGLALVGLGQAMLGLAIALPPVLIVGLLQERTHNAAWRAAREQLRSQGPWFNAPQRADAVVALERRFRRRSAREMRSLRRQLDVSDDALRLARRRAVDAGS